MYKLINFYRYWLFSPFIKKKITDTSVTFFQDISENKLFICFNFLNNSVMDFKLKKKKANFRSTFINICSRRHDENHAFEKKKNRFNVIWNAPCILQNWCFTKREIATVRQSYSSSVIIIVEGLLIVKKLLSNSGLFFIF